MAGTNQAVNLTGMLSQIGSTLGKGIDASPLTDNIKNMSRPKLDMNNPDSLERYAQWAESTGKRQEAMTYRKQAADLRKEQSTMKRATAAVDSSMMGQTAAQQGDVEGVRQQIAQLGKQLGQATSLQEQQTIRAEMQRLQGTIPGAKKVETQNKANGILQLERLAQRTDLTADQQANIARQLNVLKQDAEVVELANKAKVDEYRMERMQTEQVADEYMAAQQSNIARAVREQDDEAIQSIIDAAPQGAGGKVQAAFNSMLNIAANQRKWRKEREELATPLNVDDAMTTYEDLPKEFKTPIQAAYRNAAKFEEENFKNGQWTSQEARTRARELEKKADSLASQMTQQYAQQSASASFKEETAREARIQELELALTAPPRQNLIMDRARELAGGKDVREADFREARTAVTKETKEQIQRELDLLRGQRAGEEPEEEAPAQIGGLSADYAKRARRNGISVERMAEDFNLTVEQVRQLVGE
jgi:hypothetical protein